MNNFIIITNNSGYDTLVNLDNVLLIQKCKDYAVISFGSNSLDNIFISIETYEQLKAKLV